MFAAAFKVVAGVAAAVFVVLLAFGLLIYATLKVFEWWDYRAQAKRRKQKEAQR